LAGGLSIDGSCIGSGKDADVDGCGGCFVCIPQTTQNIAFLGITPPQYAQYFEEGCWEGIDFSSNKVKAFIVFPCGC